MTIHEHLLDVGKTHSVACKKAREYAKAYNTAQEVWDNCTNIDWLFWWAAKLGQLPQVVLVAQEIAESVKHFKNYYSVVTAVAAADAYAAYTAAAAAYTAAYTAAAAAYAADAKSEQHKLNLQIARKHLVCPWHEDHE